MQFQKYPDCPICGEHPIIDKLIDYEAFCGVPGGRESLHSEELGSEWEITPLEHRDRIKADFNPPIIVDVLEPNE